MLVFSYSVVGGVQETGDWRGTFAPGEAEVKGPVQGLRGGDGVFVSLVEHVDATLEGGGWKMELGSHAPWQGTADIPDGLPDPGKTVELPG